MQYDTVELTHIDAKPFIKWVGGKRQLLTEINKRLPKNIDVYVEPFLGGGALFFQLANRISQAYLSDINEELILTYQTVQNNVDGLIQDLSLHKNTQEHFSYIRNADRNVDYKNVWTPTQKASRFIFLNKTCFNVLYRVNSSGYFNVPYGRYTNPKIVDEETLYACNFVLNKTKVTLTCNSYKESLSVIKSLIDVGRNVFVYLDPPYIPVSVSSSFTQYSKDGFSMSDQIDLKAYCDELTRLGAFWMQSNSSAPIVFDMYKECVVECVSVKRNISASKTSRGTINEVIITNYENT